MNINIKLNLPFPQEEYNAVYKHLEELSWINAATVCPSASIFESFIVKLEIGTKYDLILSTSSTLASSWNDWLKELAK